MTDETRGDWLSVREAAKRLKTSEQAIRSKVQRRTLRSRKGNSGAIAVFIEEPADELPKPEPVKADHSSNIDRKITGKSSEQNADESIEPVPAWVYREAIALHQAELDRVEERHRAELERLERSYQLASDSLMRRVAALLVERRRISLMERLALLLHRPRPK